MVNGLGVLGWGVGGIEAEAAMLGQPLTMLVPPVVGLRLTGELPEGTTATDLVLTIAQLLRQHGVVGKFVEVHGPGLAQLPLENRATIGNMAPEYGATCVIFPIDDVTLRYLRFTGRDEAQVALVEAYAKEQGMFHRPADPEPVFSELATLDLSTVEPSLAGPARPQDRVALSATKAGFLHSLASGAPDPGLDATLRVATAPTDDGASVEVADGHVVIAAITSCTNTSNPQVMLAAGLLAQKAVAHGLRSKPWVKTSLAPGSRVVMDYYERAGLREPLETLGFQLVGFGCTTCIGNSGPLLPAACPRRCTTGDLSVAAVLSGNRNFEGRIHPDVRLNYLASPPLVGGVRLAGTMNLDLTSEPLGTDNAGSPCSCAICGPLRPKCRRDRAGRDLGDVPHPLRVGVRRRRPLEGHRHQSRRHLQWDGHSTYVLKPPFFEQFSAEPTPVADIVGARCWPCSVTASPRTTSLPPARSDPVRRPGSTSPNTAWSPRSSTPTGHAGAITRS